MPVSLTDDEKLQLSLFKLMEQKAVSFLVEDSCNKQDISSTKYECILLAVRKMCQVYIDLQDSPSESKRLCALIISYLKIIYHSNMPKSIKTAILKFIKTPNIQGCQGIISAIYALDIDDFPLYILSSLITHINRGNPKRIRKQKTPLQV